MNSGFLDNFRKLGFFALVCFLSSCGSSNFDYGSWNISGNGGGGGSNLLNFTPSELVVVLQNGSEKRVSLPPSEEFSIDLTGGQFVKIGIRESSDRMFWMVSCGGDLTNTEPGSCRGETDVIFLDSLGGELDLGFLERIGGKLKPENNPLKQFDKDRDGVSDFDDLDSEFPWKDIDGDNWHDWDIDHDGWNDGDQNHDGWDDGDIDHDGWNDGDQNHDGWDDGFCERHKDICRNGDIIDDFVTCQSLECLRDNFCSVFAQHPECLNDGDSLRGDFCSAHPHKPRCRDDKGFCHWFPNSKGCRDEPGFCKNRPHHPECSGPHDDFCSTHKGHPECGGPGFCDRFPNHSSCDDGSFCERYPNHDACGGGGDFCQRNPYHPECNNGGFCDLNPGHPDCDEGSDWCELNPEDPECDEDNDWCDLNPGHPDCDGDDDENDESGSLWVDYVSLNHHFYANENAHFTGQAGDKPRLSSVSFLVRNYDSEGQIEAEWEACEEVAHDDGSWYDCWVDTREYEDAAYEVCWKAYGWDTGDWVIDCDEGWFDNTPPSVHQIDPEDDTNHESGSIRLLGEAADNLALDRVIFRIDEVFDNMEFWVECEIVTLANGNFECHPDLDPGSYRWQMVAYDKAGNASDTEWWTFEVLSND